jgi:hypothetical protein
MASQTNKTHNSSTETTSNASNWKTSGLKLLALFFGLLVIGVMLYRDLSSRLPYPPMSDQEQYLASGGTFLERFTLEWRTPLYSIWMAGFYLLSGRDVKTCYYLEKVVSVLLLSLLVGWLGRQLFDTRTGLLLGIWVLNCKYLMIETNGSHILPASIFVLSLLCFFLPNRAMRLPAALLLLFISTQARQEMWVPFLAVVGYLAWRAVKRLIRGQASTGRLTLSGLRYWLAVIVIGGGLGLLIFWRLGPPIEHRINYAFAQTFAYTYVERHHLSEKYPNPWISFEQVIAEAMPAIGTVPAFSPWTAMKYYPVETRAHFIYNIKMAIRALPAMVLVLDHPILMLVIFLIYLASYIIWREPGGYLKRWKSIPDDTRRLMIIWILSIFLLILPTIVFNVAARYYIQLIPTELVLVAFIVRLAMDKIKLFQSRQVSSY